MGKQVKAWNCGQHRLSTTWLSQAAGSNWQGVKGGRNKQACLQSSPMCVCCRKKSSIIQSQAQIYDPQLFQSLSGNFRVVRPLAVPSRAARVPLCTGVTPTILLNTDKAETDEPIYVDPIPESTYENLPLLNSGPAKDPEECVYENMFSLAEKEINPEHSDSSDYENTEFLHTHLGTGPEDTKDGGAPTDKDKIKPREEKKEDLKHKNSN
ncbi:hypothetical protein GJAV_G00053170 [Gymnothorax javanicus]|nr:hypothetical protein GJAV_G00053170 [Gymnothorax javanicus]